MLKVVVLSVRKYIATLYGENVDFHDFITQTLMLALKCVWTELLPQRALSFSLAQASTLMILSPLKLSPS